MPGSKARGAAGKEQPSLVPAKQAPMYRNMFAPEGAIFSGNALPQMSSMEGTVSDAMCGLDAVSP